MSKRPPAAVLALALVSLPGCGGGPPTAERTSKAPPVPAATSAAGPPAATSPGVGLADGEAVLLVAGGALVRVDRAGGAARRIGVGAPARDGSTLYTVTPDGDGTVVTALDAASGAVGRRQRLAGT